MSIVLMQSMSSGATWAELGWTSTGVTELSGGRFGGGVANCAQCTPILDLPAGYSKIGLHMSFKALNFTATYAWMALYEASTGIHIRFNINAEGRLVATRDGAALTGGTGTKVLSVNVWYGIEIWAEITDSGGVVKVYFDGDSVPDINVSSADTKNGGTGVVDRIGFAVGTGHRIYMCDLVVYNDAGAVNNAAPLGDLRVEWLLPTGNGTSSALVGSDSNSTDNYLLVDETTPNGDVDYVESSTPADKDTYAMSDLVSSTGSVLAVGAQIYAKKSDAGSRSIAPVYRLSGGTEADGTTRVLGSGYAAYSEVREAKPGGGAYSVSDVNGMQVGVKIVS